jgi:hypothetical protein
MATTLNITTNFVGEVAGDYIAKMIKASNTISDGLVTVRPNIASTTFIRKIETAEGWRDYTCGFIPTGSIVLSERSLNPKKITSDSEICKEDFRNLWTSYEMGFSAHNDTLPKTEQGAILLEIAKNTARKIDREIWEGNGATGNLAGFIPQALLDADVIDVATPVAITAANVEAQVAKFIDAIPDQLIGGEGQILGVSTNVVRALRRSYNSQSRVNGTFLKPSEFDFEGYTLTEIKGLNSNTMIAYNVPNLVFGTGLLSDHNEIRVKDMDETDLSGTVRMKITLTGGVQYAWGGEVILYRG